MKATVPRFRYDQLMRLGWKIFLPISLIWVFLVSGWLMHVPLRGASVIAPCLSFSAMAPAGGGADRRCVTLRLRSARLARLFRPPGEIGRLSICLDVAGGRSRSAASIEGRRLRPRYTAGT